jgi:thioredoxin 1
VLLARLSPFHPLSQVFDAEVQNSLLSHWRLNRVSSPHIVHTTDATFNDDVLKSDKPVLLDFWAEWCGPCKAIAPILDEIATEYRDRLKIAKLNIDENPHTPPKYGIRGIPTLILFKNGTVEAQKVGALSKSQLSAFLDNNLPLSEREEQRR